MCVCARAPACVCLSVCAGEGQHLSGVGSFHNICPSSWGRGETFRELVPFFRNVGSELSSSQPAWLQEPVPAYSRSMRESYVTYPWLHTVEPLALNFEQSSRVLRLLAIYCEILFLKRQDIVMSGMIPALRKQRQND